MRKRPRIFKDTAGIPHKRGGMTPTPLSGIDSNGIVHWQQGGLINQTGYLKGFPTNQNPVNIIPSGHITTDGMAFPIYANGRLLHPDTGDYHFNSPFVIETKAKKRKGGRIFQLGGANTSSPFDARTTDPAPYTPQVESDIRTFYRN